MPQLWPNQQEQNPDFADRLSHKSPKTISYLLFPFPRLCAKVEGLLWSLTTLPLFKFAQQQITWLKMWIFIESHLQENISSFLRAFLLSAPGEIGILNHIGSQSKYSPNLYDQWLLTSKCFHRKNRYSSLNSLPVALSQINSVPSRTLSLSVVTSWE